MTPLSLDTNIVCFVLILLVPCAGAGLALINAGLGRSRNAAHSLLSSLCVVAVAAVALFRNRIRVARLPGPARARIPDQWKTMELDRLDAFFPAWPGRRRIPACVGRAARTFQRRNRSHDSLRQRSRPLAVGRGVRINRHLGGLDLSAFRPLGLGRRLARAARPKLRAWTRLPGFWRRRRNSNRRRFDGPRHHLAARSPARQIHSRSRSHGAARSQCGAHNIRVLPSLDWMARSQLFRRVPLQCRRTYSRPSHRHKHDVGRDVRSARGGRYHTRAVWKNGRVPVRQWLGGRT